MNKNKMKNLQLVTTTRFQSQNRLPQTKWCIAHATARFGDADSKSHFDPAGILVDELHGANGLQPNTAFLRNNHLIW